MPPAEAMRPEPPARYRASVLETPSWRAASGTAGRMVLRNVERQPVRAAASIVGIAFAVAVLMVGFVFIDAIERLILTQFWDAERQDVTVTFVEPRSDARALRAGAAARRDRGRAAADGAVRMRAGHRERYLAITGVPPRRRGCKRIVDRDGRADRPAAVGRGAVADAGAACSTSARRHGDARGARRPAAGARRARHRRGRRHPGALGLHGHRRAARHDARGRRRHRRRCCSSTRAGGAACHAS